MIKDKNQTMRILDGFVTAVVVITAATLVASGISISKINTEYLETGVSAAKIVAERESSQISVSQDERILLKSKTDYSELTDKILPFLPPPVNTVYLSVKEFQNAKQR